ncbi:LysR substrate-binding domain-containing protein [Streptomyces sp. NPDC051956]|uniref:LysR substrate-binding domain-containing protein n=1 Tax=Streptomyces sp. NPDC051956 TaxID=3365677 RepID=UPI0037CFE266
MPPTGIRVCHLADDPYRAVLPRNHPLTERRVIDLAELADEPWVDTEGVAGPCREIVRDACAAAGFSPDSSVASQDHATAQGFVAAGMGIGPMPLMGLRNRHPDVVLRKVRRPDPIRVICAATRETAPSQSALQGFVDAVLEAATG